MESHKTVSICSSLNASSSGDASPSRVRSGERYSSDAVVVVENDNQDWVLNDVVTTAGANISGFRGKFR